MLRSDVLRSDLTDARFARHRLGRRTQTLARRTRVTGCREIRHLRLARDRAIGPRDLLHAHTLAAGVRLDDGARETRTLDDLPAHAQCAGLVQARGQHLVQCIRTRQHLYLHRNAALFAVHRRLDHIQHRLEHAQPFQALRQILRRLIIDLERKLRDALAHQPAGVLLEHQHPQHVAHAFQPARAEARAAAQQAHRGAPRREVRRQVAQDGRAGGGDPLARTAVVVQWKALQQHRGGRRRERQFTVRGVHSPAAHRQGRTGPRRHARALEQPGRADHVGDRIPRADLVKAHLLDCRAVHVSLGLAEQAKHRQRTRPHALGQFGAAQQFHHLAVVAMMMIVLLGMGGRDAKARPGEHAVVVGLARDADDSAEAGALERVAQSALERRKGIEHRGREHVAGDAAHGIQMCMHGAILARTIHEHAAARLTAAPSDANRNLLP